MFAHVAPMLAEQVGPAPTGAERVRVAALSAFATLLAIAFLALLAADQARVVVGVL
jgi:hypothetical protein